MVPRFERLLDSKANKQNRTIDLAFLGSDNKQYHAQMSPACSALTLAAIAAHLGELLSGLPEHEHPPVQPIIGKAVQIAMRDNGALALMLTLEGGAELPLEFRRDDLAKLAEQFVELASLARREGHH